MYATKARRTISLAWRRLNKETYGYRTLHAGLQEAQHPDGAVDQYLDIAMPNLSPETVLRNYFHAKDENRPHLMSKVFSRTAALQMRVNTDSISFPAASHGIDEITDVLVRTFGRTYENVYSYYLEPPPLQGNDFVSCHWLVGMTEKSNGNVRVGCGAYDWSFDRSSGLAVNLTVTIEAMQSLAPEQFDAVFDWLGVLSYPWSSAAIAAASVPPVEALGPVLEYLRNLLTRPTHV